MRPPFLALLPTWLLLCNLATCLASEYSELLNLKVLPQANLFASFNFRSSSPSTSFERQNFRYLPRALSQILQHSHTKELHLRFGSGRWDEELWGPRPRGGAKEGGVGVEIWAWVEAEDRAESVKADARWLTLTNTLSGLFCASLNFIDSTRTIRPIAAFAPDARGVNTSNLHLLHGQLAREVVCTENLTPFLKFLPCKGKSGISSLFDGHKLFDSAWQSMSIDIWPTCAEDNNDCVVQMEQTVDMVLDIERSQRPRDDPIPRPVDQSLLPCDDTKPYGHQGDSCYPKLSDTVPRFTLSEVFGRSLKGTCPLVGTGKDMPATLCIDMSDNPPLTVNTTGMFSEHVQDKQKCYKMPADMDFDVVFDQQPIPAAPGTESRTLHVERTLSGRGQERGGSRTLISNPSGEGLSLVYLESLPWFMKPYLHTLKGELVPSHPATEDNSSPIRNINYIPALDRSRGTHLELELYVPAASTLYLSYDFDKAILRYTEYPPDPNRGFDIPPAIVRVLDPASKSSSYVRTNSLVLYLPTPDFSMPYNVIILTSTVIALGFGSIFNILVRRFVGADEVEGSGSAGFKDRLRLRFLAIRDGLLGKGREKTE